MASYINNAKFPIYTFFQFDEVIYPSFELLISSPLVLKNKLTNDTIEVEKQTYHLSNLNLLINNYHIRQIQVLKDIVQKNIYEKEDLVSNLLRKQKTTIDKKFFLKIISKFQAEYLFLNLMSSYFFILSSNIEKFKFKDLFVYSNKFRNLEKFRKIINTRIDFEKLNNEMTNLKSNPSISYFDNVTFINELIRFLNKNAFFEFSESIYSIRTKDRFSYFDLEQITGEIERFKTHPTHTSGTNLLIDLKKSFKTDIKSDFLQKYKQLELFHNTKSRQKLLFNILLDSISFTKSAEKTSKSKILFGFFKLIVTPLFFNKDLHKTDKELKEQFRYYRRDVLKIKLELL